MLDHSAAAEAGAIVQAGLEPRSDSHASAAYRKDVAAVVVRRARLPGSEWRRCRVDAAPRLVEGEAVVRLVVNGEERRAIAEPRMLLCDFLRHELGLTGTHVIASRASAAPARFNGRGDRPVVPPLRRAGRGVAHRDDRGSPRAMSCIRCSRPITKYGLQCGYCTPGLVLATVALLERNPDRARPRSASIWRATSAVARATSASSPRSGGCPEARRIEVTWLRPKPKTTSAGASRRSSPRSTSAGGQVRRRHRAGTLTLPSCAARSRTRR